MAKQTSKSKSLENTNDPFSNMKLAQGFEKLIKDLWLNISDTLSEGKYNKDELTKLEILANLIRVSVKGRTVTFDSLLDDLHVLNVLIQNYGPCLSITHT